MPLVDPAVEISAMLWRDLKPLFVLFLYCTSRRTDCRLDNQFTFYYRAILKVIAGCPKLQHLPETRLHTPPIASDGLLAAGHLPSLLHRLGLSLPVPLSAPPTCNRDGHRYVDEAIPIAIDVWQGYRY